MAQAVKYKKPRRINVVSVSLVLALGLAVYLGLQYFPLFLQKQEAYRVLEETSSAFSGRRNYYLEDTKAAEHLRRTMTADLRRVGINDPDLESWIEVEGKEVHFGVVYSIWIEWPFNMISKQEFVYEVEHVVTF